ncbi:MAG: hypothetical protein ABR968_13955 [Bacteroidales bacterium]|jgi:hypothetical protein
MKTKMIILGVIAVAAIGLIFNSCKKEDTTPKSTTSSTTTVSTNAAKSATESVTIDGAFTDAFRQVDKAAKENQGKDTLSCPTISLVPFDMTTYPKDLTIDFGSACTGPDGIVRSGQILAHLTKCYIDSGSVTTVTFNNYYVNGNKITGTEIITNEGRNLAGHPVFGVQVINGNLYSTSGVTTYNSTQQREWIQGYNTLLNPMDDVYLITGSANGVETTGTTYTVTITSPLKVALDCAWIESGTLNITESSIPVITVDYGSGACDNVATVTCDSYTFTIYM